MQGALASDGDGLSVLRGSVPLDYRTTDRVVILNLPGQAQCEFKLRLPASPVAAPISSDRGIWPIASPRRPTGEETRSQQNDAFAIRYRVL